MLPRPFYESLPILYVAGGITAIASVDSFMSFVSGMLLGATGILILIMRRNYRTAKEHFLQEEESSLA